MTQGANPTPPLPHGLAHELNELAAKVRHTNPSLTPGMALVIAKKTRLARDAYRRYGLAVESGVHCPECGQLYPD
jgi:hypothetical protein